MMTDTPVDPNAQTPQSIPAEEQPLTERPAGLWPTRYSKIFGIAVITLTLVAVVLAALAPQLVPHAASTAPAGWTQVYDGRPGDDLSWDSQSGCRYIASGLDVVGDDAPDYCAYAPSETRDLLSQGFQVTVTLAPNGAVKLEQDPLIAVTGSGSALLVVLNQAGEYIICQDPCRTGDGILAVGLSVAWHTDGYTPNSVTLRYLPDDNSVTLYTDGQQVHALHVAPPAQPELRLGADSGGEAIYTHVTVYSASAGS